MFKPEAMAQACALLLLLPHGGVAFQPPATPAQTSSAADALTPRIAPEDVLEISVLGEPELNKTIMVPADGKITYPYSGEFKVVGLTVQEVSRFLVTKLKKQLVDPQVTVSISKRPERYVSVLGAVKTPGKVAVREGWRVLNVLAESGGLTVPRAEWATATLVRDGGDPISLNLVQLFTNANQQDNVLVNSGDIILVKEIDPAKTQIQVLGEVVKQGTYLAPSDGSLVSAIASAGGTTQQAALSRAVIRRDGKDIPVDLTPFLRASQEGTPPTASVTEVRLQPGDTLFVPQNTRRFAVVGAVTKPGAQEYPEGRTLDVLEALSLAGGQTRDADLKNVVLMRADATNGQGGTTPDASKMLTLDLWSELRRRDDKSKGNKNQTPPLTIKVSPGDVLFVPDKGSSTRTGFRDMLSILPALGWIVR